jgi:sugar phosphate isomerase/epimerase
MHLSVLLSSLPLQFADAVWQAAELGFTHVDPVAMADRPAEHREALADSGLVVGCAAIGKGLPEGQSLDAGNETDRRLAVAAMKQKIADAAALGATAGYLVSGTEPGRESLLRFGDACLVLADFAAARMVRLCVEPIPGRTLASAAAALDWLAEMKHSNLRLLLDVGHCLISGEEPAKVVRTAGDRLGYVHLDDNDGLADLHWPLLTGRLTRQQLLGMVAALRELKYPGALSLELNPNNSAPVDALLEGKVLMEEMLGR